MRPPDDLKTLRRMPLVGAMTGGIAVPILWMAVLGLEAAFRMALVTGPLLFMAGVYITYRSRYSVRELPMNLLVAVSMLGSALVGATTSLAWLAGDQRHMGLAIALAGALGLGGALLGFLLERRRLRPLQDGVPVVLLPLLDMERHLIHPEPLAGAQPAIGRIAFFAALALNIPLLMRMNGWEERNILWIVSPVLGGAITYVMVTAIGPSVARAQAVWRIEQRTGARFMTSRLPELREMRRGLWLARWLCRAEDLQAPVAAPAPSAKGRKAAPRVRRKR